MLVSPQWIKDHIDDSDLIILDTRPKVSFMYGHIPNSQSLTIEQVIKFDQNGSHLVADEKNIVEIFSSLGVDESKTVVLCGESMDPSVARIAWTLLYFGHENTKILDHGINTLPQYGIELTRKLHKVTPSKFSSEINRHLRIDADNILKNLETIVLLDARSPQEFMSGHLPKAILIPFTDGIGTNGEIFSEKTNLEKLFSERQIPKDKEIVCYCMHGHRASSLFYQLKIAGYEKVKVYDGSFVDWYGRRLALD